MVGFPGLLDSEIPPKRNVMGRVLKKSRNTKIDSFLNLAFIEHFSSEVNVDSTSQLYLQPLKFPKISI